MNKPIFCIVGMSGSGKSTLVDALMDHFIKYSDKKYKKLIYHTTRAKRENEVDGVEYKFANKDEVDFSKVIELRRYIKKDEGKVFYYTTYEDVSDQDIDAYICTASVDQVIKYESTLKNVFVIALNAPVKDRILRTISRASTDVECLEICRRMLEETNEYNRINNIYDSIFRIDNGNDVDINKVVTETAHFIEDTLEDCI